jgi:hypothetical protein
MARCARAGEEPPGPAGGWVLSADAVTCRMGTLAKTRAQAGVRAVPASPVPQQGPTAGGLRDLAGSPRGALGPLRSRRREDRPTCPAGAPQACPCGAVPAEPERLQRQRPGPPGTVAGGHMDRGEAESGPPTPRPEPRTAARTP